MIAAGVKTVECRSRSIHAPIRDLVICASKTAKIFAPIPGYVYGYAIGLVDVTDCVPFVKKHLKPAMMTGMPEKDSYAYILENARLIEPVPVHASASFFYTDFTPSVIRVNREDYEKFVLPAAFRGDPDEEDSMLDCLFNDPKDLWDVFEL